MSSTSGAEMIVPALPRSISPPRNATSMASPYAQPVRPHRPSVSPPLTARVLSKSAELPLSSARSSSGNGGRTEYKVGGDVGPPPSARRSASNSSTMESTVPLADDRASSKSMESELRDLMNLPSSSSSVHRKQGVITSSSVNGQRIPGVLARVNSSSKPMAGTGTNNASGNKFTSAHMLFLLELADRKRKEREEDNRRQEVERKRREKLARAILGHASLSKASASPEHDDGDATLALGKGDHSPTRERPVVPVQAEIAGRRDYLNRHFSYLDNLQSQKRKRAEDEELKKQKHEKLRQSLQKKIGIKEVGSTKDSWFGFSDYHANHPSMEDSPSSATIPKEKENSKPMQQPEPIRFKSAGRSQKQDPEHSQPSPAPVGPVVERPKKVVGRPPSSPYKSRPAPVPPATAEKLSRLKHTATLSEAGDPGASASPKKLSGGEASQMFTRLAQLPKRSPASFASMDLHQFRKRNGIDENTKIFIITGGYPDLRDALLKRGWFHNTDRDSSFFDYRFVLKASDINYPRLERHHVVNHFQRNSELTSKVGLCRNIRNIGWYEDVDVDTFFPRCYTLDDPEEMDAFVQDFKFTAAEAVVKEYVAACEDPAATKGRTPMETVASALKVLQFRVTEMLYLKEEKVEGIPPVALKDISTEDWNKILSWGSIATISEDELARMAAELEDLPEPDDDDDNDDDDDADFDSGDADASGSGLPPSNTTSSNEAAGDPTPEFELDRRALKSACSCLNVLKEYLTPFEFNGKRNIWIVKPGRKSRGRGIQCFNNFDRLFAYTQLSRREYWVVQKYCENPLVVHKRKFDIRQWVLVLDYDPLIVFFYKEAYLRFCGVDFTLDDVGNRFMHLSNNCVQKHADNFGEDDLFEGNMWHTDSFRDYLIRTSGFDAWTEKIQPAMMDIVRRSLKCGQDTVIGRKNSFELFGYDFVVDEHLNPWLLEINSSPDFSYSTPITEDLVKQVSEDMVKITVDGIQACRNRNQKTLDFGKFEMIYRGEHHQGMNSVPSMASALAVQGTSCKRHHGSTSSATAVATSAKEKQSAPSIINL